MYIYNNIYIHIYVYIAIIICNFIVINDLPLRCNRRVKTQFGREGDAQMYRSVT